MSTNINKNMIKEADYNGIAANDGRLINIDVRRDPISGLMNLTVDSKTRTLSMKSAEDIKADYVESDWTTIEKLWAKIAESNEKKIEKLIKSFEKDLNKIIVSMEKEIEDKF